MASRRPRRALPLTGRGQWHLAQDIRSIVGAAGSRRSANEVGDGVYLADRMQRHFGGSLAMFDWLNPQLAPLWSSAVIRQALALPPAARVAQQFHRDLVAHLAPDLAEVPLAGGASWSDRRAGSTGLLPTRDRDAQPLEPGRTQVPLGPLVALQSVVAEQLRSVPGTDPLWSRVNRGYIQTLSEVDPESLDSIQRQYAWRAADVLAGRLSIG